MRTGLDENIPRMPEEMRKMVENKVNEKIKVTNAGHRFSGKRLMIATVAAVLLCGSTVFAAVSIYKMNAEKVGNYGLKISVTAAEGTTEGIAEGTTEGTIEAFNPDDIQNMKLVPGYIPAGMTAGPDGKYHDESASQGITFVLIKMDQGNEAFEVTDTDVLESEDIAIEGGSGIYLRKNVAVEKETSYSQKIYVSFPEDHYVVEAFVTDNISKDDVIKIAQNIRLEATDEEQMATTWTNIMSAKSEQPFSWNPLWQAKEEEINIVSADDTFEIPIYGQVKIASGIQVSNVDITISDGTDILSDVNPSEEIMEFVGSDGKLVKNVRSYIKKGDGISTIDEVVGTSEYGLSIVRADMEITNTSDNTHEAFCISNSIVAMEKTANGYEICKDQTESFGEWDYYRDSAGNVMLDGEMRDCYCDEFTSGHNVIEEFKPGDSYKVTIVFVVNTNDLDKMYISTYPGGSIEMNGFNGKNINYPFIDIR